jgi:hypothetical protein
MAESPEERFNRIRDAVQQSILRSYPNPNREGCPGSAVVREVAARVERNEDAPWEHITHCSPCYAEFLGLKDQFRAERAAAKAKTTRRAVVAGGGAVVAAVVVGVVLERRRGIHVVEIDLQEQANYRSVGQSEQQRAPRIVLPNGRVRLDIALLNNSEPGLYQIQLWKNLDSAPLASISVRSYSGDGRQKVQADFDVHLELGDYTLGVRNDHREAWRYCPVSITG